LASPLDRVSRAYALAPTLLKVAAMTPHQLFRETTVRPRSWPPHAWGIVAGAAIAMFIAVVLVAWQGAQMLHQHRAACSHAAPTEVTR
jgi:hypothetical protein